MRVRSALLRR